EVSVLLVEPSCTAVIDRCLEKNCLHALLPKKAFDRRKQLTSDLLFLPVCNDFYRNDVTQFFWFYAADDESEDLLSVFEHQGAAFFSANVVEQFQPRPCDLFAERRMIEFVQCIKILGLIIANSQDLSGPCVELFALRD